MSEMTPKDHQEIKELVKQVEEILSGHRIKIVNAVLVQVKNKVMGMVVFKRPVDIQDPG
jgi:hypothetical protein